ncbi:MAG: hypothetical protein GY703_10970 [Gammaproteobacteria bacterium]|nr:hypothetical protein [Gammaproteobacteria bacterium]
MADYLVWLIPTLPLLAAAWIGLGFVAGWSRGEQAETMIGRLVIGSSLLSLLLLSLLGADAVLYGTPGQVVCGTWFSSGDYRIPISFLLDSLGLGMGVLVLILCLLTQLFSVNYMHRERGYPRFFMLLSLFTGGMLLIVLAGNAVLTFVGWELAGLSSYLLIGYSYDRTVATVNATRAFVTNRVGDAGFLFSIALAYAWIGSVEWPSILEYSSRPEALTAGLIGIGFVTAALVKSAQVPFSPWIGRALEGPTPSSAVFYGAVMVHAGVYLLIRIHPLISETPLIMYLLVLLGTLTALYGWLSGLVQTDVKSSLMFSTTAQVGLMFLECGLGWFELAAWHLATHAIWRTYQFLHAPALMHLATRPARPVAKWLRRIPALHAAAMQRFWLDAITDWLLLRPTRSLAQDLQDFDQRVINRIIGLPDRTATLSSLSQWEARKQGQFRQEGEIGSARGLVGRLLQWFATLLYWFEEHLVLKGGSEGLESAIKLIGRYLQQVEQLLSQPRYLLLMIMVTFVVIL